MSEPTNTGTPQVPETAAPEDTKRTPSDFLKSVLGRPAVVKLNSGIEYRGVLACLDGYLNIAMEQTQEFGLDGQLKATYGDCFIRGNNVLHISSQAKRKTGL
ncbi:Lsm6 protein-like protein [Fragilariopsis cylindrus CCMP1102]|uniref:Lsm6 protein-like protein n=1 Tax=Fragilariopsis cylindrus CCMP1102 TaxID=635003 RepID=A0A1E7EU50_9STRA|nr:Lsm6 protein-like protein [Fragilariopsis cylindrus CCMP1102]|eukprot:OEU09560.1 Lsm6 protein-like protein [Fragilariopsis cylindrus CCMP1102]